MKNRNTFVSDSPDTNSIVPPLTIHSTGYKRKRSQFDDPKSKSLDEDETLKRVLTEGIQPDGVLDDIFSKLIEQLDALSENLIDQLKIYELESKYLEALNSYKMPLPEPFDLTLEELITKLTYFTNCAFEVCNWAETASNKLTDIEEKNYIKYTGTGIQTALSPLYTGFEVKRNSLQERIDYLKGVCDVQNIDDRIPRDTIMDF
jgi:hypothetical protein